MSLTVGSLFSGIGGFDLAAERAGYTLAYQSEIEPYCCKVLAKRFPGVPNLGDVTKLDGHALHTDVIVGGSPCSGFSVAGIRKGLEDERSGLFSEFVRIIDEARPRFVLWENVPGVLNSAGGRDFGTILGALADLGALDIYWRIVDARFWGVAQRRRRVFLVADFGGERAGEILLESEGGGGHPTQACRTAQDPPAAAESRADAGGIPDYAYSLTSSTGGASGKVQSVTVLPILAEGSSEGVCSTATSLPVGFPDPAYAVVDGTGHRTGTGRDGQDTFVVPQRLEGVRRLMPVECERLMGFPDDWTHICEPGEGACRCADTNRYRALGNAVVVNVVEWILRRMKAVLEDEA